jgi:hypothetical protein
MGHETLGMRPYLDHREYRRSLHHRIIKITVDSTRRLVDALSNPD